MKSHKCPLESRCTGFGESRWVAELVKGLPKEERIEYIIKNEPYLKMVYCSTYCPVTKFYKKYGERRNG